MTEEMNVITFSPVGIYRCPYDYKQEQPRQGAFSAGGGYIELRKGHNYEQALRGLDGFDRLWLVFAFHHNSTWKPVTNPPRNDGAGRKGVFATRSPYRPNPVGLSCVTLEKIEGNRIYVCESDLLNNTPIIDIKPYISDYDSFPDASRGWLDNVKAVDFDIEYSDAAAGKSSFLEKHGIALDGVIRSQLGCNPFDRTRNKLVRDGERFVIRFKSWRIFFLEADGSIRIDDIESSYTDYDELFGNDTQRDLEVHRLFNARYVCR